MTLRVISDRPKRDLTSAVDGFLLDQEARGLAAGTIKLYRYHLADFLRYLGSHGWPDLDRESVVGFAVYLQRRRQFGAHESTGKRLSPKTIREELLTLRSFLAYLHEQGDPAEPVHQYVSPPRPKARVIPSLSTEQVAALLRQPDRKRFAGFRCYVMTLTLMDTGLRLGELLGIRLGDIDWTNGLFRVVGKGGKERIVPFGVAVRRELRRYLDWRGDLPDQDVVFVSEWGQPLCRRSFQDEVREYGRRAGITGVRVSPHTLRHTFAREWVLAGGDVFSLQKLLGHTTMDMVRRYVDLTTGDLRSQHACFSPADAFASSDVKRRMVSRRPPANARSPV